MYEDVTEACFSFYFRQVRAGPHENFHYVIGDPRTRQAALIDPAFGLERLFGVVERDGYVIRDAFFTHGHWDHIGGVPEVVERGVDRIYIHEAAREHPKVHEALVAGADVGLARDGDAVMIGDVRLEWLHTPGHQPESSCFLVAGNEGPRALFGGDTLFIDTCGRTDFTGGDMDAMFTSMARLRGLAAEDILVLPGHDYADRIMEDLATQVRMNPALATTDRAAFGTLPFLTG